MSPAATGSPSGRLRALALLPALGLILAGSGAGTPVHAQGGGREVDSGRFQITRDGQAVGSEVFAIRREASSLRSVARLTTGADTALVSERIVEARMQTNAEDEPELFELQVQRGGDLSLVGVRSGSRFRLRTRSAEGERWKEFLVPSGLVILPSGFVHFHHYLFDQRGENGGLTALLPMEGVERPIRVEGREADSVRAEGGRRAATRWEITVDDQRRLVWRDEDGRILRVEIPAEDWVAVRTPADDAPSASAGSGRASLSVGAGPPAAGRGAARPPPGTPNDP